MEFGRWVLIVCVVVFTALAAVTDMWKKKLPNVLTVPAFGAALVFHATYGAATGGWSGLGQQLLFAVGGFATGFGLLFLLWQFGSGGGGDVKFMGALGAWLGCWATVQVFLVSAALIVVGSMGMAAWEFVRLGLRRFQERYLEKDPQAKATRGLSEPERRVRRRLLPYGVPAALATWLVLCWQMHQG